MSETVSERKRPAAGTDAPHGGSRPEATPEPPRSLLSRVRGAFLLFGILMAALAVPLILQADATPGSIQASAIAGLLWLVLWWVRGYRRGRFPVVFAPLEGLAVFAVALATGAPPMALGLIYSSLMFRSLYGNLRSVVLLLLLYLGAFFGALGVASRFGYLELPATTALAEVLGLPLVAATFHVLALTISGREAAITRERTLRESAAALVAALDREGVYGAALEGAQRLTGDVPGTRVCLAVGPPERMIVLAVGDEARDAEGAEVNLHDLPASIRDSLLAMRSVNVDSADPETVPVVREALGFEPKVGSAYHVPLHVRDEFGGLLVVSSDGTLPSELKASLDTLGSQIALALESIALTEELYRRRAEGRLHSLLENTSDLLTVIDAEGTVLYESPSVERVLGYKPEELVGESGFRSIHPDDIGRVRELFAGIADRPGPTPRVELRVRHRDGSWRVFESVGNNLLHDPDLRGIVINSRDVTERKDAEKRLQQSEANLAEAQRIARLGSWEYEVSEDRVLWSDETYRIFGFSPRQFVPTLRDFSDRIHPDDRELMREDMAFLLRGERPQDDVEFRVVRPDGVVRFVQGRRYAEIDDAGAPVKVYGTIQDVTERRRAEESLRASEAELRALFEAMNDLIAVFDREGRCLKIAPTDRSRLYRPPEEMLRKTFHELFPKEQADTFQEHARRALETGGPSTVEFGMRLGDRQGWFEVTFSPMLEDTVLAVVRDVTGRKESERALRESEASLAAAQKIAHLGSWDSGPLEAELPWERRGMSWSDEMYRILGFAPGEVTPSFRELVGATHPDDMEHVGRVMRESTFRRESYVEVEHRIIRRDGELRAVQAQIETVFAETGEPARRFGTVLDVTERKRVEDELRRRESELAAAQRMAGVGNWTIELDEDEIRWSDEMYRIFGYEPQGFAVTYKKFVRMVHPDDRKQVQRSIREAVYGRGGRRSLDYRLRRPDGEVRFLHSQYEAALDEGGRPVRLVGTSQDVTERRRAEEALRQSEERYRAVVEQAGEGIFLFDPKTKRILESNLAFERLFGYEPEELARMSVYDLIPQDPESVNRNVERALEAGHILVGERRYRRKDGSFADVEVSGSVISYGGEEVICSVARDVTERKRAEAALQENHNLLRGVTEGSTDAIFVKDLEGRYLLVNSACAELFGRPLREVIGRHHKDMFGPDDARRIDEDDLRIMASGETRTYEETLTFGGRKRTYLTTKGVRRDHRGNVAGLFGVARDITERKRAEELLRQRSTAMDASIDGMAILDEDATFTYVNDAHAEMYGYAGPEELLGQTWEVLYDGEQLRWFREHLMPTLRRNGHWRGEAVGRRRDGSPFPQEVSITTVGDSGFVCVVRDVTERKRIEEEIRRLNEGLEARVAERTAQLEAAVRESRRAAEALRESEARLRQSNRELQDFAYVASHDLQEPLRKVRAFGDRLRTKYEGVLGEQGRDYLGRMESSAERMQCLIEDLLVLSRVTTKGKPFVPVDLGKVVREVLSDLEARIEGVGGSVEVGELPTVEADRAQMRQLFQNLISNALKFRRKGETPVVEVRAEQPVERGTDGDCGGGSYRITVKDNGIGFGEEHAEKIFAPFERLHGRSSYEGTGMGLAICRRVAERHGGAISARSVPGQGATFTVTLPAKQPEAGEREEAEKDGHQTLTR